MTKPTSFWWVFLLLWVLPMASFAQSDTEGLIKQLEAATSLKDKMVLSYQIAEKKLLQQPRRGTILANQSYKLAQQLEDKYYERYSALLLGKLFIKQSDDTNAIRILNTAKRLGKSHKDGSMVLQAATLLSSVQVRKNNYKRAYELNLDAINFINRNKSSLSKLDQEYGQRKRALEAELKNLQAEIDKLNAAVIEDLEDTTALIPMLDTNNQEIKAIDSLSRMIDSMLGEKETDITTPADSVTPVQTYERSAVFPWLAALLGLLSLGLLGGLYYFWNKLNRSQEKFDYELVKKERLLRNYREEIEESERLRNQSIFGNGQYKKARKIDPLSMMIVDMGKGAAFDAYPDGESFAADHQKLLADIQMIIQLHPAIFYLKKIGTTLIFGTGLSADSHAPDQLIGAAKDLQEYFLNRTASTDKPKIAIHSGAAIVSTLDLQGEQLDILGHTFDQCAWLVAKAKPGQTLVSGKTQVFLREKDHLLFHSDQKDWSGIAIKLYELNS